MGASGPTAAKVSGSYLFYGDARLEASEAQKQRPDRDSNGTPFLSKGRYLLCRHFI